MTIKASCLNLKIMPVLQKILLDKSHTLAGYLYSVWNRWFERRYMIFKLKAICL